jgi:creatinine amidohydrolase
MRNGEPVIVPIGARAKEHGHHLPMKTDYLLARSLCDGIIAHMPALVAPVIDFGYYPAFRHYPGSQHLRPETFSALVRDVIDGFIAQNASCIAIVNTGVSTEPPLTVLVRETYERTGVRIPVAHIRALGKRTHGLMQQKLGGHADEHETSMILAIDPSVVHMDRAAEDYGVALGAPDSVFYVPTIFRDDPAGGPDHSATGVRGDPSLATAEKGRAVLSGMIDELVRDLSAFVATARAPHG